MAKFVLRARRLSRTKTLVGGALCAAGLAFFVLGRWAGVTNSWPVRFPLQLIEGRPKPIAMMPESGTPRWIAQAACWTIPARSKSSVPTGARDRGHTRCRAVERRKQRR